ncbi:hypothetical protein E2C01_092374 [Portunus trituberculatus]|uniref:Uncharacterized protein n=1 Tax=Portunus trituberculatus TaxID=210409 RepID=A0A5B7JRJ9_PORTR|nr:hypothetical protein [Portunus trituberculatus]
MISILAPTLPSAAGGGVVTLHARRRGVLVTQGTCNIPPSTASSSSRPSCFCFTYSALWSFRRLFPSPSLVITCMSNPLDS